MNSRQLDEEAIFHIARQLTSAEARATYLDQVCGGDAELRDRAKALLAVHELDAAFLKSGAVPDTTLDPPKNNEAVGEEIGRYKLREPLGEGGFGVVWAAEQLTPVRRKVALKIIKPGMDTRDIVARFEAERQALALMDHPNIARVFDGGTTPQGRPYFVMELIRGVPITDYCDENRLTIAERLKLFIDVCKAIQHAHQKGIIHRDIKPSNVLVTLHDNDPVPKVIDFGVAKALSQQLTDKTIYTRVHAAVGTLAYMAPEQAALTNQDIDTRADVYGLGALLYELLTGTTPLDSKRLERAALDEAIRIIREEEPPRASTKLSSLGATATAVSAKRQTDPAGLQKLVRGELDWILLKALEKDRTRRYETASALASDVLRLLNHEPVEACPPSMLYRTGKLIRRHRVPVAAATILTLILIGGIVGTSTGWWAARQAIGEANEKTRELEQLLERHREELYQHALTAVLAAAPDAEQRIRDLKTLQVPQEKLELLRGLYCFYKGEPESAVTHFDASLAARDSVAARAALAMAMENCGNYEGWTKNAYPLLNVEPDGIEDQLLLAQCLMVVVDSNRAVQLAEAAAVAYPSPHTFATVVRAKTWQALLDTGDLLAAEKAASDIRSIHNTFGDTPYVLEIGLFAHVTVMILAGPEDPRFKAMRDEADKFAARILEKFPRYPYGRLYRAVLFDLKNQPLEAEEEYRQLVTGISQNENWKAWHALVQYRNGNPQEAWRTIPQLSSYAMMCVAPLLCDTEDDRKFVLSKVQEVEESLHGRFTGDYHIRPLLFIRQRTMAEEMARRQLRELASDAGELASWQNWEQKKLQYYVGDINANELLETAGRSPILLCDAHSLIAADFLSQGKKSEAHDHFSSTVGTRVTWWLSYHSAIVLLKRLDQELGRVTEPSCSTHSGASQ